MSHAKLTIIVPTYNRAAHLAVLLAALRSELRGLESHVEVLVSDNASTDTTPEVTAAAASDWPALSIQRHDTNIGPEGNFLSCVHRVSTRYFWIIGDDDCPKRGVLDKVVNLLVERMPSLVYIQSEWVNPLIGPDQGECINALNVSDLDAISFAASVNTWLTFISGIIVNRERLMAMPQGNQIDRFVGSYLVQLGWILPLLNTDGPFFFLRNKGILATSGNTGGYGVLETFCSSFPGIINEFFGEDHEIARAILERHIFDYLPSLIWNVRFNEIGFFVADESRDKVWRQLRRYPAYWLFLWPIANLRKGFAWPFYAILRIASVFGLK